MSFGEDEDDDVALFVDDGPANQQLPQPAKQYRSIQAGLYDGHRLRSLSLVGRFVMVKRLAATAINHIRETDAMQGDFGHPRG